MKRTVKIKGMTCDHCARSVRTALDSLKDISSTEVYLEQNKAIIDGDASEKEIRDIIEEIGFEVEGIEAGIE